MGPRAEQAEGLSPTQLMGDAELLAPWDGPKAAFLPSLCTHREDVSIGLFHSFVQQVC